jgi:hypothetical protein
MLADTRNIDGRTTANQRSFDERPEGNIPDEGGAGVPVRRIGLEQEFFLVEQTGVLCDLADLAKNYLSNLNLALEVGAELGLGLYPLATYPLPIRPVVRNDPGYRLQARTIGHDRFLHAGRCAGVHLHLEYRDAASNPERAPWSQRRR